MFGDSSTWRSCFLFCEQKLWLPLFWSVSPEPLDRFAYSFRAKGETYCKLRVQRFGFPKLRDPFKYLSVLRVQVSAREQEYADILATPIVINLSDSHPGSLNLSASIHEIVTG